jgi:mannose-6-phosphate isomerase-like protein (cupin superfamily)
MLKFDTKPLPTHYDYLAPDQSEIRLLLTTKGGGLCHCTLPPGQTSTAVTHKTVDEIWYFLQGQGEVWRKQGDQEECVTVQPGVCLTIPLSTHFQFRNTGKENLCFVIATMPPWPGADEAEAVKGYWQLT